MDEVKITCEALHALGLKIESVVGEENFGVGLTLNFESAVYVVEGAVARADVVVGLGGFKMLAAVIKNDMTGSH